jgi:TonB family protein
MLNHALFALIFFSLISPVSSQTPSSNSAAQQDTAKWMYVCSKLYPPESGPCGSPPKTIYAPSAQFPDEAKKLHMEGTVLLWLIVQPDGTPSTIRVKHALGYGFDLAAVDAVKQWRFKPATYLGAPVPVAIEVEVRFHQ